jgi:hypothetical protein
MLFGVLPAGVPVASIFVVTGRTGIGVTLSNLRN